MCGVRQVTGREVERTLKKLCIWEGRDRERGEKRKEMMEKKYESKQGQRQRQGKREGHQQHFIDF